MNAFPALTILVFSPLLGALILMFVPVNRRKALWGLSTLWTLAVFLYSLWLWKNFPPGAEGFQFEEHYPWIRSIGASYHLGIDGLSLSLILLTTLLTFLGIVSSYRYIEHKVREYVVAMLIMETGMLGVFTALDLLLFFFFWEAMLIPMYFLIAVWGHERRVYAAFKFVLYTMAGSVFLLISIIVLYFVHQKTVGLPSFDLLELQKTFLTPQQEKLLFLGFALAFAIKIPLVPFHTWLPDAHVEAPTAGSVLLAGVLLKMGVYGFLRFAFPLFPSAAVDFAPLFAALGIVGIIYGAWMAWVQEDLKKLIAYSSVAHLGFVTLGIFALNFQGIQGATLQMINHGISTGALFLIVGMLYERRHTRLIREFGGLARVMPVFATLFGIVMLSSIGLPGTNGFVGEFTILLGAFQAHKAWAVWGVLGIIFAAVYMLSMFQRVMFLQLKEVNRNLPDLSPREFFILGTLVLLIFWIGIYPKPLFRLTERSSLQTLHAVQGLILEIPPAPEGQP